MDAKGAKIITKAADELGLRVGFWTRAAGFTLYDAEGAVAARVMDERARPDRPAPFVGVIRPKHLRRVGYKAPDGSAGTSGEGKYFSYENESLKGVMRIVADPRQLDK